MMYLRCYGARNLHVARRLQQHQSRSAPVGGLHARSRLVLQCVATPTTTAGVCVCLTMCIAATLLKPGKEPLESRVLGSLLNVGSVPYRCASLVNAHTHHHTTNSAYVPEPQTLLHRLHPVVKQVIPWRPAFRQGPCTKNPTTNPLNRRGYGCCWCSLLGAATWRQGLPSLLVRWGATVDYRPCLLKASPPTRCRSDDHNAYNTLTIRRRCACDSHYPAASPVGAPAPAHAVDLRLCAGCHCTLCRRRSTASANTGP